MLTPIGKIVKELNVKSHQLHKWEERGWLGFEPVLKDPDNNGQRTYSEEQVRRIKFIHAHIEDQRKRGIKRTDLAEVEVILLEEFGGEVTRIEKEEMMILPSSIESIMEMMRLQSKKITELQATVERLGQKEIPHPKDHSSELDEIKKQLKHSEEREGKLISLIEHLQDDIESLKEKKPLRQPLWQRVFGG